MHLPIYVSAHRLQFRATYTCPTLHWAGQKIRDFRDGGYEQIEARDGMRALIDEAGVAMLACLPSPNSV